MSTRRPWKFRTTPTTTILAQPDAMRQEVLAHLCLQARISIVPVLVRSEYCRLLDGAVR